MAGAHALFSPTASKTIARFMIYASLHPETCGGGQLFNIADRQAPCTFAELWPQLAQWFGMVGVEPPKTSGAADNTLQVGELPQSTPLMTPGEYITQHMKTFIQHGRDRAASRGVGAGFRQLDSVGYWLTFDRQMSIKKLRETGFEQDSDPAQAWLESFEMFRNAGLVL